MILFLRGPEVRGPPEVMEMVGRREVVTDRERGHLDTECRLFVRFSVFFGKRDPLSVKSSTEERRREATVKRINLRYKVRDEGRSIGERQARGHHQRTGVQKFTCESTQCGRTLVEKRQRDTKVLFLVSRVPVDGSSLDRTGKKDDRKE